MWLSCFTKDQREPQRHKSLVLDMTTKDKSEDLIARSDSKALHWISYCLTSPPPPPSPCNWWLSPTLRIRFKFLHKSLGLTLALFCIITTVSSFILTLPSSSLCMSNLSPSRAEFIFKCLVCLDTSFYCHIHLLSGPFNGFLTGVLGPHHWSHCVVLCKMQIWPLPHSSVTLPVALSMEISPHPGSGSTLFISGPLSTPLPPAPWAPPCFQASFHQGLCARCSLCLECVSPLLLTGLPTGFSGFLMPSIVSWSRNT